MAVCNLEVSNSLQTEFFQMPQLAARGNSECWTYIMMMATMMMMMMMKIFVHFTSVCY
jgi:hypothetical protein